LKVARRLKTIAIWTALLAMGSASLDLAELRDGAAAMACCAKTDYSCAGMRAPDDCCRSMGHAASHQTPATIEKHQPLPTVTAILADLGPQVFVSLARVAPITAFTRPHDPPHLHPFALLI
jgi:hypothetical protein